MTTIELTSRNLESHIKNMREVVQSEKYVVTVSVVPKSETSLAEYLKSGVHTDDKYGPFTSTDSLFASLDA
jgi:hypothetical protein